MSVPYLLSELMSKEVARDLNHRRTDRAILIKINKLVKHKVMIIIQMNS